uniref:MBD domain-containing protein n=1 Tax=Lygus hesperus TaxID=30085 RepID=A0A0K8SS68_LYGHE
MSGAASDPKAEAMEVNEDEISNGLSDTMDVNESKGENPVAESKKPGKITRVSRKSSSSVSSERSASKESSKHSEGKDQKLNSSSDDEDFLGFSLPIDGSAREKYLRFLRKEKVSTGKENVPSGKDDDTTGKDNEPALVDDDVQSQSDKMSVENVDSDSNAENTTPTKSVVTKSVSVKKSSIDIDKDEYKKPFEFGWVREVVYRTSSLNSSERTRRSADVYYYTPSGKKVRSSREVADYLTGELSIANFTFVKEPIGVNDPKKEIVRHAEPNRSLRSGDESSSPQQKKATPTIRAKPKSTNEVQGKGTTPKVAFKFTNKKLSAGKKPDKSRKSIGGTEIEDDSSEDTDWDMVQKNPTREVCSIECRLAMGLIPTLQCVSCLCLYHPECVGVQQDKLSASKPYSCKNCQGISGQQSTAPKTNNVPQPPALIPLSPQNTSGIPRIKSTSKSDAKTNPRQNIVGTVTTWLPSSSSIQVSQSSPTPKTSTTSTTMSVTPTSSTKPSTSEGPRQGLLEIGSNAFVVVPRTNVVNVSNQTSAAPAVAATANTVNPSQTQTNGILLVPLSIQPPDSTLADSTSVSNPIRTVNPGVVAAGSAANVETNGLKRVSDSSVDDDAPPAKVSVKVKEVPPKYLPNNFFSMSNAVTMSMHYFFQYLKVHELLRATQVNKTWHFIATHQSLWETVRMKNSKVRDFEGFGNALRKYNTKSLDLRKMITPESPEATTEMWSRLASVISTLPNLKRVDFGRCAPSAIEVVAAACSHLESVTSLSIRGSDLNLSPITNCLNLVELKLKSFGGIDVKNLHLLKQLTNLKSLYLTSVKNLEGIDQALPESLENLELGECVKLPEKFAVSALPKLVNLKRLRLERGGTGCPTLPILHTIASLPKLTQLELINFDIKPGFDKALSKCTNIKILLIIPTYVTQSATTNHVVMGGVSKLSASLQYFIWGLTLELLRVTDLFIDQVEGGKSKSGGATGRKTGAGDSIPILKPLGEDGSDSSREGSASQVDILGLPKLQRVLSTLLPQTKIKILKIPLSATWRQTVTDIPV